MMDRINFMDSILSCDGIAGMKNPDEKSPSPEERGGAPADRLSHHLTPTRERTRRLCTFRAEPRRRGPKNPSSEPNVRNLTFRTFGRQQLVLRRADVAANAVLVYREHDHF